MTDDCPSERPAARRVFRSPGPFSRVGGSTHGESPDPEELADLTGLRRPEILRLCMQEAIPVYQGRIDKTLFIQSALAAGRDVSDEARAALV